MNYATRPLSPVDVTTIPGYNRGYSSGSPVASETAHWPRFHRAYLAHVLSTYGNASTASFTHDRRLIDRLAFLLGVVSHGAADVAWHALDPRATGIIRHVAALEQRDDYQAAHTAADVGGDFIAARDFSSRDAHGTARDGWRVPVRDVMSVYRALNVTDVSATKLVTCMRIGFVGTLFMRYAGHLLYAVGAAMVWECVRRA